MPSAKEPIAKILQDQPEDSSYEEILRELALAQMVDRGLADSDAERTISHEEMGQPNQDIAEVTWTTESERMVPRSPRLHRTRQSYRSKPHH